MADGVHVALIGHVTRDELREKLLDVEVANGFANRHLFCGVERSKLLPSGGNLDDADVAALGHEVRDALEGARKVGILRRTPAAEDWWGDLYSLMARDDPGGMVGAVIARDAAQVLRLSVVYALTDGVGAIDLPHLEAAWAVWRYCRRSAADIFGERTGDPVADKLLGSVRRAGAIGLTTDQQHEALGRHTPAVRLKAARDLLVAFGLATMRREETGGSPASVLVALDSETSEESETSRLSSLSLQSSQAYEAPTDADLDRLDATDDGAEDGS